jgi:proteic killer suppression protein
VKLRQLDVANNIEDLKIPPSNFLEKLKGSRKNQHSIRINKQWSVCFEWHNNNAINVEIVDYH